jgi:hypothetical protein
MQAIKPGRAVAAGLVAGLVMNASEFVLNGVVLASTAEAATRKLNLQVDPGQFVAIAVGLTFAVGVVLAGLYAALRPRFATRTQAAIVSGLVVWFLVTVYGSLMESAMTLFPFDMQALTIAWGAIEAPLAALAAAAVYGDAG